MMHLRKPSDTNVKANLKQNVHLVNCLISYYSYENVINNNRVERLSWDATELESLSMRFFRADLSHVESHMQLVMLHSVGSQKGYETLTVKE